MPNREFQHPLLSRLTCVSEWCWDADSKSECISLSDQNKSAYFFDNPFTISRGTAAVRGNRPFQNGLHYFEILFQEPLYGTAICVGLGTEDCQLNYDNFEYCNLVGRDSYSYGLCHKGTVCHNNESRNYCEPFFEKDTVVGVLVDMARKEIHYFINNKYMGLAFTKISTNKPLYAMVSSTSTDQSIQLINTYTVFYSLQDLCCQVICRNCDCKYLESLPLSRRLINHLKYNVN